MNSLFESDVEGDDPLDPGHGLHDGQENALLPPKESSFYIQNQDIEKTFLSFITGGHVPHAVILSGPKGIGKATFAYRLSRFLLKYGRQTEEGDSLFGDAAPVILPDTMDLKEDDPVFRRILSGGHADFLSLEPLEGKKGLDVEQIRKVAPFLRKTASEAGGWRVVLIDDADSMNRNAQNALLKILEEPPQKTLLILVTHNLGAFLPTIRSRCRTFCFDPLDKAAFSELVRLHDSFLEPQKIDFLYEYSSASVGQSIQFVDHNGLELFENILAQLSSLPDLDFEQVHLFCEQFGRGVKDESWQNLKDIFLWIFQSLTLSKARGQELPGSLAGLKIFMAVQKLDDLLKICEHLQDHFKRADIGHLDKRQAVLETFMMIDKKTSL